MYIYYIYIIYNINYIYVCVECYSLLNGCCYECFWICIPFPTTCFRCLFISRPGRFHQPGIRYPRAMKTGWVLPVSNSPKRLRKDHVQHTISGAFHVFPMKKHLSPQKIRPAWVNDGFPMGIYHPGACRHWRFCSTCGDQVPASAGHGGAGEKIGKHGMYPSAHKKSSSYIIWEYMGIYIYIYIYIWNFHPS